MCGIVGYVGQRPALELLLGGLERLEHRGYDSAGVALLDADGTAVRVRSVGGIAQLREAVGQHPQSDALRVATAGLGHTRWATHGRVSEGNAHPLSDDAQRVQIVLNGIVENHAELRAQLESEGARDFGEPSPGIGIVHRVPGFDRVEPLGPKRGEQPPRTAVP